MEQERSEAERAHMKACRQLLEKMEPKPLEHNHLAHLNDQLEEPADEEEEEE